MNIGKVLIAGFVLVVITGFCVQPVQAHRRYRPHFKGLPRQVLVPHSHDPKTSIKPSVATGAKVENSGSFELFEETARIITGTVKNIGNMVSTVFGGKAEAANDTQKVKSQ